MATTAPPESYVDVAQVDDVSEEGALVVRPAGRTIALFAHEGEIYATDHRCPHMGFPLTEGTIEDGILTCHWHHARFELSCGDTLDPFADDVQAYPVVVHDDRVYVDPQPKDDRDPVERWTERLEHGLQEDIGLVIAKAVIGLEDQGVPPTTPVSRATQFGVRYNAGGWGRGLTTLGVMTNLYEHLRPEDRARALYVGISEVADESAGQPPFFPQDPLSASDVPVEQLDRWFRENIEVRDADGAERVLRAAVQQDLSESALAAMLVGAATDHLYLDTGHRLDFINKAFEVLDHIGWDAADEVLPSLVPGLASAGRAEERSSWRQPVDLADLLFHAYEDLRDATARERSSDWQPDEELIHVLLSDEPQQIVETILGAVEDGAPASALAGVVAQAAARRVAQFGVSNEFRDWNTVHHTYTYANAVQGLAERTDSWVVYRGIFDGAMSVYLDRFLNMPPTPIPEPGETDRAPSDVREELLETFEVERDAEVDRAGRLVSEYLDADGSVTALKRDLGEALLREDVGFHTRQNLEAAFAQWDRSADPDQGRIHLIATARYLAAHTPTRRADEQTFRIAERLNRGESIHEATEEQSPAD